MLKNYIIIAFRNLMRNKLYAAINIGGLAIGLTAFVFAVILAQYEKSHDVFFEKSDRIFTLGSTIPPTSTISVKEADFGPSALAPILELTAPDIEATARTVHSEFLLSVKDEVGVGTRKFYESIRFTDKTFLTIFDLIYIEGDASALDDPASIILTESLAKKLFPKQAPLGQVLTLDHEHEVRVTAVIQDYPKNSHFVSMPLSIGSADAMANLSVLTTLTGYPLEGYWDNKLNNGDVTYVLLPARLDANWLSTEANKVFDEHATDFAKELLSGIKVRPLQASNLIIWEMVGWPVIEVLVALGMLVLIIASLNYANLSTAQAFGRAKEVGLRKTVGASRRQLLAQFLVENIATAFIALLLALVLLETIIPMFNQMADKAVYLDYGIWLPILCLVTLSAGLLAGGYPSYIITQVTPVDALKGNSLTQGKSSLGRSFMIAAQFVFSVFMLAIVSVVYFQNERVKQGSDIYPKSQVVTLQRMGIDDVVLKHESLKHTIEALPGVEVAAYSSQVPFEQNNSTFAVTKNAGDQLGKIDMHHVSVDYDFLQAYNIPLAAGRYFSEAFSNDLTQASADVMHVIVNELGLNQLGFSSAVDAVGKSFYQFLRSDEGEQSRKRYVIVGVMQDQNFMGLHNGVLPFMFYVSPERYTRLSVRISGENFPASMAALEQVWADIVPDYPIQLEFSEETFQRIYQLYTMINTALAGFAVMGLVLAFIGLFGLAAFMAEKRTKEIGLRKVLGASTQQIILLLIWQLSRPVMWALCIALPVAYLASDVYLQFFADRIENPLTSVLAAGVVAVVLAWLIVAVHAVRVSRTKPISALRHE